MNWMTSTYHRATNPKRAKQRKLMHFARHTAHEIHSGSSVQRERETDATPWYQTPVRADSESMDILMLQYGRSSVVEHHSGSRSDGDCVVTSESTRRCSFTPNPKVVSHGKGKCSTVLPNQDVPTILYYNDGQAMRKAARSQCEQSAWSVVSDKARSNPPLTRYAEFSDCEYKCREATNNTLLPNIGGNRILQVSPQSSNINSPRLHQFDSDHTSNHITEEHHFRDTPPEYRPLHATAKDEDDEASLLSNVNSSDESDPIRRPEPALHLSEAFDCSREGYMQWSRPKSPESTVSNDALRMSNALAGNQSAETFISEYQLIEDANDLASYESASQNSLLERPPLDWQKKIFILHSDLERFDHHSSESNVANGWKMSARTRQIFHRFASNVEAPSTAERSDAFAQVQSVAIYLSAIVQCYQIEATITTKKVR